MDDTYQRLLKLIQLMSPQQLGQLEQAIWERRAAPLPDFEKAMATVTEPSPPPALPAPPTVVETIEGAFLARLHCPHCSSIAITKWGAANGLRRYRCKACKATFNALTGSPLAQLHNRELWGAYAQTMIDGLSLRKAAARTGASLDQAFRWRHRFMKAPKDLKATKLSGTVEADETYFRYSEKGKRKLSRKARKRGGDGAKRGLSDDQVPVLIVRDRNKQTTDQVLPDRSEKSLTAVLKPVVAADAILVSDGALAYGAFADKSQILHISLVASKGERCFGIYHIQNVNAYISGLKNWMVRFKGVATKNLDTYLGWNRMNDRHGSTLSVNQLLIAAIG